MGERSDRRPAESTRFARSTRPTSSTTGDRDDAATDIGDEKPGAGGTDGREREVTPKGNQRDVIESQAACTSVDAGAGTGKTTTMIMRLERAIENGEVDPEDVLVLTFANEAAASIREAISETLAPADAAAIDVYTYHSFCYRLVREYAYYLGRSPELTVLTGHQRRRIVTRLLLENEYDFADDSLRDGGSATDLADTVYDFIEEMSRENVDPDALESGLPAVRTLELLRELVLWLEREARSSLSFENESLRWFNEDDHLDNARESLVDYGTLITYCREKIAQAPAAFREDEVVRDVDRYLLALQACVTNTREALDLEEPTTKQLPRALFGNEIHGLRAKTRRLEQTPIGRLTQYLEYLRRARHYAEVYADYRAHLERERIVDFDELVRLATRLLEDDAVSGEITDRWTQVYCDEFQDTDETQFELITELTRGDDRPDLLAIGDKDQAIYGWRGTDREGLDRLADVYDEHVDVELELNFRSKQEILDLTNHCSYGPQSTKTLREDGRVEGTYAVAKPPIRVAKIESSEVGWSTPEQVATTVSRLLNGEFESVPQRELGDVAIIVRTNYHAQAIAEELRSLRIPFEISGSPRGTIAPGMQTLLSYLRVLVDPTADAHLRRVLLYRYRLSEPTLERLQSQAGSLYDAVFEVELDGADDLLTVETGDRPRLARAREHLSELERLRDVYPLSQFVQTFKTVTRLEWFLTSDERAELERVERFVDRYDADAILGTLTLEVVDALEEALRGNDSGVTQGERSDDSVDVMTVHQAKGLQFDTVLVPYLTDEEWCVHREYTERARSAFLGATLEDDVSSPLLADLASETVGEEWRVLHVALTRAENHLFLFGSAYNYEGGDDELGVSTADSCLAESIEWSVAGQRMDLWDALTESFDRVRETYPETVADLTDEISVATTRSPGRITYYAGYDDRPIEPLETREAIRTVHRLGRLLRAGTLLPAADGADVVGESEGIRLPAGRQANALTADTTRFPIETLTTDADLPLAMRHSYSSMQTRERCARKHYLDHVVRAIDDPPASTAEPSARLVGSVFHAVAEEAFYRAYHTREEWREATLRQLTARNLLEYRSDVLACIDRFFDARAPSWETPVHEWESLAAELRFTLEDVPGVTGDVVGVVDSVRRLPDGTLAVLDYKATATRIDPAEATQLSLYLHGYGDRFDDPVTAAGYVYVGDGGDGNEPRVDLFSPSELPPWSAVLETLESVDDPTYEETTPGDHCRFCAHRSLGCGPDEYSHWPLDNSHSFKSNR